ELQADDQPGEIGKVEPSRQLSS
ncbi:twin-arginine translocase TatA/TatE family subunit, partial [Rhodococcus hoagii]|nr:twin-arginine translocase TatA/TatE family subunit [Prescottella equi]